MTEEEIFRYIFTCVCYKHNNDISSLITESAYEKENLLFENAVEFLKKLEKENKINEVISKQQLINDLKKEIDYYKSLESHYDEIEEDAKAIAEENTKLQEKLNIRSCQNCKYNNKS